MKKILPREWVPHEQKKAKDWMAFLNFDFIWSILKLRRMFIYFHADQIPLYPIY